MNHCETALRHRPLRCESLENRLLLSVTMTEYGYFRTIGACIELLENLGDRNPLALGEVVVDAVIAVDRLE